MSLSRKADKIIIGLRANNDTGGNLNQVRYLVTVQDKDVSITPEFFTGSAFDETIGARKISNLRGFRVSINLSYNASRELLTKQTYTNGSYSSEESTFRDMFNEIMSAFNSNQFDGGRVFMEMNVFLKQSDGQYVAVQQGGIFVPFIPTDMSYEQTYRSQIGLFKPSITLTSQILLTEINEYLEGLL